MAETDAGVLSPGVQFDAAIKERMAERRMQCPAWVYVERSCGCVQWIVAPCSDPTCEYCQKIWADRMRERWFSVLAAMRRPKLITLTIPSSFDLAERVSYEAQTFRRFLDTRLGPMSWPEFEEKATMFLRKHLDEYEPDVKVREERYQAGVKSLEKFGKSLKKITRVVSKRGSKNLGKTYSCWPRVRDVIGPGFSSREVTWSNEHGWHLHRHLTVGSRYIPWHLLVVIWESAGGGPVVDIRPLGSDYMSIRESLKYVTKFWTIPDDKRDEVRMALKGLKKIWPLGGAKPVEIDHICPECKKSYCTVEEYRLGSTFRKYKDGETEYMDVVVWGVFDEEDRTVTLMRVDGRWREKTPSLDPHGVCVPSGGCRDGPDPPNGEHADSVAAYQEWLEEVWN